MRALLGIIHQTVLGAVRSRLFVSELLLVLLVSGAGPLLLQSDGTLNGHVTLTVRYILSANWLLLGLGILWAAGSDMSQDIASKRLHLVRTKPVGGIRLLIGRWCGLLALHTVLALLGIAIAAAMVSHTSNRFPPSPEARTILLAHAVARPVPSVTPQTIRLEFDRLSRAGRIPPGNGFDDVAPTLRSSLLARHATVNPDQQQHWRFEGRALHEALRQSRTPEAWLRFRFTSSAFERTPISGTWTLATPSGDSIRLPVAGIQDGEHVVQLPHTTLSAMAKKLQGEESLTVSFGNTTANCAVMLDTLAPLELLVPRTSLGLNMLRASTIMIASLGALAALGLLCGVLFSGPVAAVVGLGVLACVSLAMGTADNAWADSVDPDQPVLRRTARITDAAATALRDLSEPAIKHHAVRRITAGEWLSPGMLTKACLPLLGLYAAPLLILGGAILNRRQLGGS